MAVRQASAAASAPLYRSARSVTMGTERECTLREGRAGEGRGGEGDVFGTERVCTLRGRGGEERGGGVV